MSPHKQRGESVWRIYVPTQAGGTKLRSTGTRDKATARSMERMVLDLGPRGKREWDLLAAVTGGSLKLGALFDAYRRNELGLLRSQLADVDLATYLDRWQRWLAGRVRDEGALRYQRHLATLHQNRPWLRSSLTPGSVEAWLSQLAVTGPTKRRYFAALSSFLAYLELIGIDHGDPLRKLSPPPAAPPRVVFLELPEVRRVLDAAEEPFRTFYAVLYATALDTSTAARLKRRDVDLAAYEIRGAGTKTHTRDRIVIVAEWGRPFLDQLVRGKLPDAPLFPGLNVNSASDRHREILKALGLRGTGRNAIRLHDARHHWAARAARAGTPIELVARQLGHVDGVLALRCYGRFVPSSDERRKWEEAATRAERPA